MTLTVSWVGALLVLLIGVAIAVFVMQPWSTEPPQYVHVGVVEYDDSEATTLRDSLHRIQKKLFKMPKVVTLWDTVSSTPDTIQLNPSGSWRMRRLQSFDLAAGRDTVSLTVMAEHEVAVWSDSAGVLFRDGQMTLQVRDLVVRQAVECPAPSPRWLRPYAIIGAAVGLDEKARASLGLGLRIRERIGIALIGSTDLSAGLQLEMEL